MSKNFLEAIINRRTYYNIDNNINISNEKIIEIVNNAVKYTPSAFNSQSSRAIVLFGKNHLKLWEITKDELRKIVPKENFKATEDKINSFSAGYGTVLFYEDNEVVENLQKKYPEYSDAFTPMSEQVSGMVQLLVWTMFSDEGLGASLQHYNNLIDEKVKEYFDINKNWRLIAQMPFGNIIDKTYEKTFEPIENRVIYFKYC